MVIKMGDIIFCVSDGDYLKKDDQKKNWGKILAVSHGGIEPSTILHLHVTNDHFLNCSR